MQKALKQVDERPPVIVFTCGRTGSTLLIRILNCLPSTIMWGEHNGALKPLLAAYSRVRDVAGNPFVKQAAHLLQPVYDREPVLSERGMSIEWLNWFTAADIDRLYRALLTGLFYPDFLKDRFSRWGFKEIQYRTFEVEMLRQLFPGLQVIILYRNPAVVFESQFKNFAKNKSERMPKLLKNIEGFFNFAAQEAARKDETKKFSLFISYEEIVGDFNASLLKLQHFLAEEFSPSIEEIGENIASFRARQDKSEIGRSGNPLDEFVEWQKLTGTTLPPEQIKQITDDYYAVVKASAAETAPAGGDLCDPERAGQGTAGTA